MLSKLEWILEVAREITDGSEQVIDFIFEHLSTSEKYKILSVLETIVVNCNKLNSLLVEVQEEGISESEFMKLCMIFDSLSKSSKLDGKGQNSISKFKEAVDPLKLQSVRKKDFELRNETYFTARELFLNIDAQN
ncbi:MAG: hypothetical protein MI922_25665 [Bacteroidales bacterium]|nr:hypothetical protein [Bacteroidales bacterium]